MRLLGIWLVLLSALLSAAPSASDNNGSDGNNTARTKASATAAVAPAESLSIDIEADANLSRYLQLKEALQRHPDPDPLQASLQQALIDRLITLVRENRSPLSPDPLKNALSHPPRNTEELQNLVPTILRAHRELSTLEQEIARKSQELDALKKELGAPAESKKNPLTLRLQYLYTRELLKKTKRRRESLEQSLEQFKNIFLKNIDRLRLDPDDLAKTQRSLQALQNQLQTLSRSRDSLLLERERLRLLGKQGGELERIESGIAGIDKARNDLLTKKLQLLSTLYIQALKEKSKKAFDYQKEIDETLRQMDLPGSAIDALHAQLAKLTRTRLGIAATIQSAAKQELSHSAELFWKKVQEPLFSIGDTPISLFKLIIALLIFTLGLAVGWLYKRSINRIDAHNVSQSTRTLLSNLGYYLIVTIAFFATLNFLGISLTSLALVAGALSVGIGFGLQNIVSNFVSGIILMFERSLKVGDYIELDNDLRGHVTDIRMRSVTINTNANIDIIVPNQQLIENRVINWTMNDKIRRFEIPFGVAYGTLAEQVVHVVLEAVGRSGFQDIYTGKERFTRVIMTGMGESSVDFELLVWIKGNETLYPKRTVSRFLTLIYTALNEAGIEIPFPQRDLHIRSADVALPIILQEPKNKKNNE
jgi:potassium efflux system protein